MKLRNQRSSFVWLNTTILSILFGVTLLPFESGMFQVAVLEFLCFSALLFYISYPQLLKSARGLRYLIFMGYSLLNAVVQVLVICFLFSTEVYSWGFEYHEREVVPVALVVVLFPSGLVLGSVLFIVSESANLYGLQVKK